MILHYKNIILIEEVDKKIRKKKILIHQKIQFKDYGIKC